MKILVAEDDELNQMVVRDIIMLLYPDAEVLMAKNGKEALELFFSEKVDLVISDIEMPEMNGVELMKKIKEKNPSIPVIAFTAFAVVGDKERLLLEGFDDYVAKPVDVEEFKRVIDKYISGE